VKPSQFFVFQMLKSLILIYIISHTEKISENQTGKLTSKVKLTAIRTLGERRATQDVYVTV
jgi:hypothetical protein